MSNLSVIILNGPPGSGKDTLAKLLVESYKLRGVNAQVFEFKAIMFKIAKLVSGASGELWDELYSREQKELPQAFLGGLSARQFMIRISEEWMKPTFGPGILGQLAYKDVRDSGCELAIFSDGGFQSEVEPFQRPGVHLHVMRLYPSWDSSFDGDSRNYLFDTGLRASNIRLQWGNKIGGMQAIQRAYSYHFTSLAGKYSE